MISIQFPYVILQEPITDNAFDIHTWISGVNERNVSHFNLNQKEQREVSSLFRNHNNRNAQLTRKPAVDFLNKYNTLLSLPKL